MDKGQTMPPEKKAKKGGKRVSALFCNIFGTLILLAVIALLLPLSLPRMMGYEVYNVVSGSMEPAIPTGSMILVRPVDWSEIQEGDVIAFESGGSVIAHRVVRNRLFEGEFVTKGDANEDEDMTGVPYSSLIGRVERHIPRMGDITAYMTTAIGKVYLFALIACGLLFHVLAGRLREA